ncbi:MAG: hypothetical protein GY906_13595 [bacterium]|nr:hypothetical protein [bacterium]
MRNAQKNTCPVLSTQSHCSLVMAFIVMAAVFLLASPTNARAQSAPPTGSYVWLDADGEPLPFQSFEEIIEHLSTAEVVERKPIGIGTTGAEKIILEKDGVRVRAAFRWVDEEHQGPFEGLPRAVRSVRDAAIFECAAYELSQALGLERVPPAIQRRIDRRQGTVQIWLEGGRTETEYAENSLQPPDIQQWNLQKHLIFVFDALVANIDRNKGNIMFDPNWQLWFIDHTRAFPPVRILLNPDSVSRCSRDLWRALQDLDEDVMRQRLAPYLKKREIDMLFKRHEQLIKHIEKLIKKNGEETVLFDL